MPRDPDEGESMNTTKPTSNAALLRLSGVADVLQQIIEDIIQSFHKT